MLRLGYGPCPIGCQELLSSAIHTLKRFTIMPTIASRLSNFTESVIREMTRIANRYGAVNLSQGFPVFDPPAELIQAAKIALEGDFHHSALHPFGLLLEVVH